MCHFITVAVPVESNEGRLRKTLRVHGKTFAPFGALAGARALFPADVHCGLTTREHCDCGTVMGSALRREAEPALTRQRSVSASKLRKFKRRGWSAVRIGKWLQEDRSAAEICSAREANSAAAEAEQWAQILRALVGASADGRAWLLLHWYSGNIETEHIGLKNVKRVGVPLVNIDLVEHIEEDVLYEFYA